jgi:hypothetical protein
MSISNSIKKIKINKLVSSVILGTTFSVLLLFGLIFYVYFNPANGYPPALKEAFSITASFFGGIATLVAAYIAAQLFNDWRVQHNKQITNEFALKTYNFFSKFEESIFKLQNIFGELTECIDFTDEQPLSLEDPAVKLKKDEITLFFNQIKICKSNYELFLNQLADYSIMSNKEEHYIPLAKELQRALAQTLLDPNEHSYSTFNEFYFKHVSIVEEHYRLARYTRIMVLNDLLKILQE